MARPRAFVCDDCRRGRHSPDLPGIGSKHFVRLTRPARVQGYFLEYDRDCDCPKCQVDPTSG